jgi:glyoxylase-like metal-dependent hydrolase (beta-lactamase superfamily II)
MPAIIKILVKGYLDDNFTTSKNDDRIQPTIVLVRDEDVVMVVDPGILEERQSLIDALADEGVALDDVNIVCVTHSHIDHYRNVGMFQNAKVLEYFGLWDKNTVKEIPNKLTENIEIICTPGHDYTSISLLVKTDEGVVAICGDVFWKENYPKTAYEDPYASDFEKLEQSRKKIVEVADWIIPGHGDRFKNEKNPILFVSDFKLSKKRKALNGLKCRKCGKELLDNDKCRCRTYLCSGCCECDMDCHNCSCSHRVFKGKS